MLNKPNQQHIAKHFLDNNQILQKQRALFHSVAVPLVFFLVTCSRLYIMSLFCITRKVYGNETHQHLTKTFHFFYFQLLTAVGPHAEASASSRRAPRPLADIPPRAKCIVKVISANCRRLTSGFMQQFNVVGTLVSSQKPTNPSGPVRSCPVRSWCYAVQLNRRRKIEKPATRSVTPF